MPSQVGRSGWYLLPQEAGGGQIPQGGATVPQEVRLGCRLQEPPGGLAGAFEQCRLTKRSRELGFSETRLLNILLHQGTRSAPLRGVSPPAGDRERAGRGLRMLLSSLLRSAPLRRRRSFDPSFQLRHLLDETSHEASMLLK